MNVAMDKYWNPARELRKQWNRRVMVIQVVTGAVGTVLEKGTGRNRNQKKNQNNPEFLGSARILRRALSCSVGWGQRLQNTPTVSLQRGKTSPTSVLWPTCLGLQNTLTASLLRGKTPPNKYPMIHSPWAADYPSAFLQRDNTPSPTSALWSTRLGQQNTPTGSL